LASLTGLVGLETRRGDPKQKALPEISIANENTVVET
jgi:hypothetical protein